MRIAFDARPLMGPRTGVGVWLEALVRALLAARGDEVVLAIPRRAERLGLEDLGRRVTVAASPVPVFGTLWLHTLAAPQIEGRADVVIGTLGVLPRRLRCPAILVVHDLTPLTRPHHHTLANRFCFNAYFAESLERADAIVCVSEATRARLAARFARAAARATVIREGVDPFFTPALPGESPAAARSRFAGGRRFFVQLGTLEPRKGITTLLAAHGLLLQDRVDAPDLVLAGGRGWGGDWLERALARHPNPDRVHRLGYVSREDARSLLRHAEAVVLAAEEEGFGLPLAEAIGCGAACIASDEPALVEVAGGAARHFPRRDVEMLAGALDEMLDVDAHKGWRTAARARAAALDWAAPTSAWRLLLAGAVADALSKDH